MEILPRVLTSWIDEWAREPRYGKSQWFTLGSIDFHLRIQILPHPSDWKARTCTLTFSHMKTDTPGSSTLWTIMDLIVNYATEKKFSVLAVENVVGDQLLASIRARDFWTEDPDLLHRCISPCFFHVLLPPNHPDALKPA